MTGRRDSFTRKHTQIAKGIAILLMVYHHLFVIPERLGNNYTSIINLAGYDFQSILANFSKICVGIFLFLSGIGFYYTLIKLDSLKQMYKKVGFHGLKFMTNYWIIVLLLFPIGLSQGFFKLSVKDITYVFFASYDSVSEWWFVRMYIVILILAPLFIRLFQRISVKKRIAPLIVAFSIWVLLRFLVMFLPTTGLFESIEHLIIGYLNYFKYFDCIIVFIIGLFCARYNFINYFLREGKKDKVLLSGLFIISAIIIRVLNSNTPTSMNVDFVVVPMFIIPLTVLLYNTKLSVFLIWFGKHSTNIWLTHTFWCYYYGQKIVLLPKYSLLIYIWLLILSIVSSYLINLIYVPIFNLLFTKEHRLCYKNYLFFLKRTNE